MDERLEIQMARERAYLPARVELNVKREKERNEEKIELSSYGSTHDLEPSIGDRVLIQSIMLRQTFDKVARGYRLGRVFVRVLETCAIKEHREPQPAC